MSNKFNTTERSEDVKELLSKIEQLGTKIERLEKITLIGTKNVLTLDEVVLVTGLSKGHIYRLTSTQGIPHYKPKGRNLYFKKDEIEEWLLRNRIATKAEIDNAASTYIVTGRNPLR